MKDIQDFINYLRNDYTKHELDEGSIYQDPVQQFKAWFEEAVASGMTDPNAMVLSTASGEGKPSSRVVLLRGFDQNGFVFYTNYDSQKGKELQANPYASLNFFWPHLEKQIRIDGIVSKVAHEQSEAYFSSRPRESQIGAWASEQSSEIENRQVLENRVKELEEKYQGKDIPKPPHWGGFNIRPTQFEFWQGRSSRLHDRIVYKLSENNNWVIKRIAP